MDFAVTGGQVGAIRLNDGSVVITGIGIKAATPPTSSSRPRSMARSIRRLPCSTISRSASRPSSASGRPKPRARPGPISPWTLPLHRDFEASSFGSRHRRSSAMRGFAAFRVSSTSAMATLRSRSTTAPIFPATARSTRSHSRSNGGKLRRPAEASAALPRSRHARRPGLGPARGRALPATGSSGGRRHDRRDRRRARGETRSISARSRSTCRRSAGRSPRTSPPSCGNDPDASRRAGPGRAFELTSTGWTSPAA